MKGRCRVCGDQAIVKSRCRCCYEYRRNHGHDRPHDLIRRLTERDIEKELASKR